MLLKRHLNFVSKVAFLTVTYSLAFKAHTRIPTLNVYVQIQRNYLILFLSIFLLHELRDLEIYKQNRHIT